MRLFGLRNAALGLALIAGLSVTGIAAAQDSGNVLGDIMRELLRGSEDAPTAPVTPAEPQKRVPFGREDMQLSFAPLVKATTPAVVNVYATQKPKKSLSPFAGDPFFEQFFGRQMPPRLIVTATPAG